MTDPDADADQPTVTVLTTTAVTAVTVMLEPTLGGEVIWTGRTR